MEQELIIKQQEYEQKECNNKHYRTHRVGTVTLGISLVGIGVLFLLHMFFSEISYQFIYKVWPVIFILLGIEILLANGKSKEKEFVYDKTAICLVAFLMIFAMLMAVIGFGLESSTWYYRQSGQRTVDTEYKGDSIEDIK